MARAGAVSVAQDRHVVCLQAFVCLNHVKAHQLALAKHAATTATDGAEVHKDLVATVTNDKAEAFLDVEPLDGAFLVTFRSAVVKIVFFVVILIAGLGTARCCLARG